MQTSRLVFLGALAGALALAASARAEGVGKAAGAGPARAAGADGEPGRSPAVGEYAVVHHLTWLYRSPEDGTERWADNRTRADNQTEYLAFQVTDVRGDWVQVAGLDAYASGWKARPWCYGALQGMADLGLLLWLPRDQLQRVNAVPLNLPQEDGSGVALRPGVVFEAPPAVAGDVAATLREYGLEIPVTVPAASLAYSYAPAPPPPIREGSGLLLDAHTPVRFAGQPVDLGGAVAVLWLDETTAGAVRFSTSCGRYHLLRDRPEPETSTGEQTPGTSLDGVGMMMLGTVGETGPNSAVLDLLSEGDAGEGVNLSRDPVIPKGTAYSWPDGQPAGTTTRDVLLFGRRPEFEREGRPCYRLTLGRFACDDCADNVPLCFALPAD